MKSEHKAALAILRSEGFQVIAWTPEEMEGLSDESWCEMEDRLITLGNEIIDTYRAENEEADDTCPRCNGCGEGQYDGSRCSSCGGKGVIKQDVEWDE